MADTLSIFIPPEIDDEIMQDVVDEVHQLCDKSVETIGLLADDPSNRALLDQLFRSVHTIKGDIGIAQLSPILPLLSAFEDVLGLMRASIIQRSALVADLLLVILDHSKYFVDDCAQLGRAEYDANKYQSATDTIARVQPDNLEEHQALLTNALIILEPSLAEGKVAGILDHEFDGLRVDWAQEVVPDLVFFRDLMYPVEQRMDNWEGRSNRQLKLAILLNQFAGKPVDENQLRAAVYLHDIGMTILPISLLRQTSPLLESELIRVRGHVTRGSKFLDEMPHWSQARQFIHEHHERADGKGYPQGLNNDQISDGAKIIALVDAFEAMTHERSQEKHKKRSMAAALLDITKRSGTQFCPYWVTILNGVMASILK